MMLGFLLVLFALAPGPAQTQAGFQLLDVESVEGRPVVAYRPVELGLSNFIQKLLESRPRLKPHCLLQVVASKQRIRI